MDEANGSSEETASAAAWGVRTDTRCGPPHFVER